MKSEFSLCGRQDTGTGINLHTTALSGLCALCQNFGVKPFVEPEQTVVFHWQQLEGVALTLMSALISQQTAGRFARLCSIALLSLIWFLSFDRILTFVNRSRRRYSPGSRGRYSPSPKRGSPGRRRGSPSRMRRRSRSRSASPIRDRRSSADTKDKRCVLPNCSVFGPRAVKQGSLPDQSIVAVVVVVADSTRWSLAPTQTFLPRMAWHSALVFTKNSSVLKLSYDHGVDISGYMRIVPGPVVPVLSQGLLSLYQYQWCHFHKVNFFFL